VGVVGATTVGTVTLVAHNAAPAPRLPPAAAAKHAAPDLWADALAGALACGVQDLVAFPFDTLKVRAQTGSTAGLTGLWRGCLPSAALRSAHGLAWLPAYSAIKHAVLARCPGDHPAAPAAAAAIAAAGATLVTAAVELPCEALLLRFKSAASHAGGAKALLMAATSSKTALASLWAGATPFILRAACYEAVEFVVYEALKHQSTQQKRLEQSPSPWVVALWAAAAATAATVASHPLDCARVASAVHTINGPGKWWFVRGLGPRLGATIPGALAFFTVYEAARDGLVAAKHAPQFATALTGSPGREMTPPMSAPLGLGAALALAAPPKTAMDPMPAAGARGTPRTGTRRRRRRLSVAGFRCVPYDSSRRPPPIAGR
jgi:Mitochondrial carrier protein